MATVLSNTGELVNLTLDARSVEKLTTVVVVPAGDVTVSITCQHLTTIDAIYDVEVKATSPPTTCGVISHKSVSGPILALTLQDVVIATTLTLESCILGF